MLKGLVAGTVDLTLALAQGAALPDAGTVLAAGMVGFLGYGVSIALFVLGLRHMGTARARGLFLAGSLRRRAACGDTAR